MTTPFDKEREAAPGDRSIPTEGEFKIFQDWHKTTGGRVFVCLSLRDGPATQNLVLIAAEPQDHAQAIIAIRALADILESGALIPSGDINDAGSGEKPS